MPSYLYVLSNPSMAGLIKIGRTTTSPSQRMAELHSTGVPTPFILELSVEVADSVASEKAAHRALSKMRLARNREFFRISVQHALRTILPVIGAYKAIEASSAYGLEAIERDLKAQQEEKAKLCESMKNKTRRLNEELRAANQKRYGELESALAAEKKKYIPLGKRPDRDPPMISILLILAFVPIPFGGIFWMASFVYLTSSKAPVFGPISLGLVASGCFTFFIERKRAKACDVADAPFREIDNKVKKLEEEIKELRQALA